MTIYLLVGFLGSGKTTWAKKFVTEHPNTKIVSADGFREMLNGGYKYLVELDDIISASMVETIKHLLAGDYDVIVDVGNLTKERRSDWMEIPARKVAVLLPQKDKQWHINNRLKKPHWNVDWDKVATGERNAFEPIDENDFDEIMEIEEW